MRRTKGMRKAMANKWTSEQQLAIEHGGSSIIVSAAAGSGKTAVLVERILRNISGADKSKLPCDINNLLVVTFTNAAAAEMRAKIASAISALLAKEPKNMRMRRQLALMPSANIQTVHSFCLQLIRDNFHLTGLRADFSILDDVTARALKGKAMEEVLEKNYSREDTDGERVCFDLAVKWFSDFKSDIDFQNVILEIYEKLKSCADMYRWMDNVEKNLSVQTYTNAGDTVWGAYILDRAEAYITNAVNFLRHACNEMECFPDVANAYGAAFCSDIRSAEAVIEKCRLHDWNGAFAECEKYAPQKLSAVRKFEDKEFLEMLKADREVWKKAIADICKKLITEDSETVIADIAAIAPVIKGIFSTVRQFDERFSALKLERNMVDYNDLEHIALKLLLDENGQKTQLAEELAQGFFEIMVDEYQDTNEVQDAIFSAISKNGGNLFMVGDVKQSIYRFRLADPSIFLKKYLTYKQPSEAAETEPVSVSMSKNFRSRKQVLAAANLIFGTVMSEKLGDIDYTDREALHLGASYPNEDDKNYNTEVCIIDNGRDDSDDDGEEEIRESGDEVEAEFVAGKIKQLIDGGFIVTDRDGTSRRAESGDFAILLRSTTGKANIYREALAKLGIAAVTDEKASFFETAEIISVMSLLKTINNFSDDTYVISAMRSPAYGFSSDELAQIRISNPELRFFEAVKACAEEDEKCAAFVQDILSMRESAADIGISGLIWSILTEKRLLSIFGEIGNGEQRKNNLLALYQSASAFENSSLSADLGSFVGYMDELQNDGLAPQVASQSEENGVRIMSIHKSKGLEFPIVIVPDCAKKFNEEDTRKAVLFHSELGLGLKMRNFKKFTESPSVIRNAVSDVIRSESLSEELRILYVALTRAKEKLIITMTLPDAEKKLDKWAQNLQVCGVSAEMLKAEHSPAMWIVAPLINAGLIGKQPNCGGTDYMQVQIVKKGDIQENGLNKEQSTIKTSSCVGKSDEMLSLIDDDTIAESFNYEYPYRDSSLIPSKITATELNRANNLNKDGTYTGRKNTVNVKLPDFMPDKPLSAAEKGIANHLAMQFMRFDKCTSQAAVSEELQRLKISEILSEKQYEAINQDKIMQFFKTELFDRISRSDNVKKEFKFSMFVPAKDYFTSLSTADNILLQGVVDCMFEEDGKIVIVDFKSDNISEGFEAHEASKYKKQLEVYAYAMQRVTGKPVKESIIYFLKTGKMYSFS